MKKVKPLLPLARCCEESCTRRVTCAHFREAEVDNELEPIRLPVGWQAREGCPNYVRIGRPGFALLPWTEQRTAVENKAVDGYDPLLRRFVGRRARRRAN